ncbi:MAG: transcription elongation factor 1 family protein [Promethearchaeota archaeon]
MGRRRRKKVVKRHQKKIPNVFVCPDCDARAVTVELFREEGYARVHCGACGIEFNVSAGKLTEPVDAYGDFIDQYYKEGTE